MELNAGNTAREALIHVPASATKIAAPLVFAFHGHGGTMRHAALSFALHAHWPEAIVVYPQGLPTPGRLMDPEGKRNGWQFATGEQEDRDLKFVDALLAKLKQDFKVDESRVYATGHSNGGAFTYLLWAERADRFAAFAPSAAVMREVQRLTPKPALHCAGEKDALVKFPLQQLMMQAVRKRNGCNAGGEPWNGRATRYGSPSGTPFFTFIHPGGHEFPREASPLIVKFFKEHALAAK